MATVTFLVHPDRPDALELATATSAWLTERGDVARILQFSGPDRVSEAGTDVELADVDFGGTTVAVSMGGDGTFLRVVRLAATEDVPVLGVNFGRLGYLPDLLPDQVRGALTKVFEGKAIIEDRCALDVAISDRSVSDGITSLLALNEVVIEKIDFGHTIRLATTVDGEDGPDLFGRRPHRGHADRLHRLQPLRRRSHSGADPARHGPDAGGAPLLARPQPGAHREPGSHH